MRALNRFDQWVQTEYATSASGLGLYRIAFALVILIKELPQGLWVASFPDSFFNPPPGPTFFFFHGFPSLAFFYALNGALVFATVCMLFGCWTKTASATVTIGFTLLQAWEYSFGKINHEFIVLIIPILLGWAGWGKAWSVDAARHPDENLKPDTVPISLFAFILSVMMLLAGAPKIASGWLDPRTHAVLSWVVLYHFMPGWAAPAGSLALKIRPTWLWEPLDWFSCGIEVAFICFLYRRSLLRVVCGVATLFHLGIMLLLLIYSWGNVLAYGAIADWDELAQFVPFNLVLELGKAISEASRSVVVVAAAAITAVYCTLGNPVTKLLGGPATADLWIGCGMVVLAAITGSVFLLRRIHARYEKMRSEHHRLTAAI